MIRIINQREERYSNFIFKSHPACIISPGDLKNFQIVDKNLSELLSNFDTVICPASSGSSVEAYILGLKTILYIENEVNTSPLYKNSEVYNFSDKNKLLTCLNKPQRKNTSNSFFYLDKDYNLWNQLLNKVINESSNFMLVVLEPDYREWITHLRPKAMVELGGKPMSLMA